MKTKVSVILLYWKRPAIFEDIIKVFLSEDNVDEIIVFDNSGTFKTDLPVTVINSSKNFGAGIRMNVASFAKNDCIIYCDDDTLPVKGVVADFLKYYDKYRFVGTHGKVYRDYNYFDKITITADNIDEPKFVDYLCYNFSMIDRKLLATLDLNEVDTFYLDDLWLSYKLRKLGMDLPVVPTKNFTITKHNLDDNALNRNKESQKVRHAYLQTWEGDLPSLISQYE